MAGKLATKKTPRQSKQARMERGQLTLTRILDAAAKCIATHGIDRTTTRLIAQTAGVANGLVSYYFPDSSLLFEHLMKRIARQISIEVEVPSENLKAREKILHMARTNIEFFFVHPDLCKCAILSYFYAAIDPRFRRLNDQITGYAVQRINGYLEQFCREERITLSHSQVQELTVVIHSQIGTGILKFFSLSHNKSQKAYLNSYLQSIDSILSGIKAQY